MPELPEVETIYRNITPYIQDTKILGIDIRIDKLRWPISEDLLYLKNIKIINVKRIAKYLVIYLENNYHIVIHLGMTGKLLITKSNVIVKHDHIDIRLDNGYLLKYNDSRRFGCFLYVDSLENLKIFQNMGLEPLSKKFNVDYLYIKSTKTRKPIKLLLMDNRIVVGVGNIYASEILFSSKINPLTPSNRLTKKQLKNIVDCTKQILNMAIENGGTSFRDYVKPDGNKGNFVNKLNVYGRAGEYCYVCKKTILSVKISQRSTFYCPKCQI